MKTGCKHTWIKGRVSPQGDSIIYCQICFIIHQHPKKLRAKIYDEGYISGQVSNLPREQVAAINDVFWNAALKYEESYQKATADLNYPYRVIQTHPKPIADRLMEAAARAAQKQIIERNSKCHCLKCRFTRFIRNIFKKTNKP